VEQKDSKSGDPDSYGATVLLTIKDANKMQRGSKHYSTRAFRILFAHMILWVLIGIQFYLLIQIKMMVCSPAVRAIRQMYDKYQRVMYDGHVVDSGYGFALGVGGPQGPHFNPENFNKLSNDFKGSLCQIPFSQRGFLFILLLIWTLTVVGELKWCVEHVQWIHNLPNKSLRRAVKKCDDDEAEVVGLPRNMKLCLVVLVIPRALIAVVLLWLGCRWLASTTDFGNLLANSVALEFVVGLNSMLYDKLMSEKNKSEAERLKLRVEHGNGEGVQVVSVMSYLGSFVWGMIAVLFVYLYMFKLQMVIPGYQWDVKGPCSTWAAERYDFWRI
jgi:hypothetical protein